MRGLTGYGTAAADAEASLREWSASRGLAFTVAPDVLPPATGVLRRGLGVGSHRAARVVARSKHTRVSVGGLEVWPERRTLNACAGELPGGTRATLAHHAHLERRPASTSDGPRWVAVFDTVVVFALAERGRAFWRLRVRPGAREPVNALATLDLSGEQHTAVDRTVASAEQVEERHGRTWYLGPAEPPATLDRLAAALAGPLDAAPSETVVEAEAGMVCVSAPGALTDAAALEALWSVAAALEAATGRIVAGHGELHGADPLPPPDDSERARWVHDGVALVDWSEPPASVADALAAYRDVAAARGTRSAGIAGVAAMVVGIVASLLWAAAAVGLGALAGSLAIGAALGAVGLLVGLVKTVRAASGLARAVADDEVAARARPWAVEAFARGYAAERGLRLIDPESFRRRYAAPLPGRPVRVLHGDLGDGVHGFLTLWLDRPPDGPARHWLLAVLAPSPTAPAPPAPYFAHGDAAALTIGVAVAEPDRSAAKLDELRAVARALVRPAAMPA